MRYSATEITYIQLYKAQQLHTGPPTWQRHIALHTKYHYLQSECKTMPSDATYDLCLINSEASTTGKQIEQWWKS